jgi:hypothetical protein
MVAAETTGRPPLEPDPARDLLGRPPLVPDQALHERPQGGVVEDPGAHAAEPPPVGRGLGVGGPVEALAGVAGELARDGGPVPAEPPGDLADREALPPHAHYVLALADGKMLVLAHGRLRG